MAGCGRPWKDVEGHGRLWKAVAGCDRLWKALEDCGRLGLSFLSTNEGTEIPEVH